MTHKLAIIAGHFDHAGGESWPGVDPLAETLTEELPEWGVTVYNGGSVEDLEHEILPRCQHGDFTAVFCGLRKEEGAPRVLREIKRGKPIYLIMMMGVEGTTPLVECAYGLLGYRANLGVQVQIDKTPYPMRVFDPLGNIYGEVKHDIQGVGRVLARVMAHGLRVTRMRSIERPSYGAPYDPLEPSVQFQGIIEENAGAMQGFPGQLPEGVTRFLGNASFRRGARVFMTRRNISKTDIDGAHAFTEVWQGWENDEPVVFARHKPSVDTPIQLRLYREFPSMRYMLHLHAYLPDAPFTGTPVPCGALEEADEVIRVAKEHPKWLGLHAVNLLGHGCLLMAPRLRCFKGVEFLHRPCPEVFPLDALRPVKVQEWVPAWKDRAAERETYLQKRRQNHADTDVGAEPDSEDGEPSAPEGDQGADAPPEGPRATEPSRRPDHRATGARSMRLTWQKVSLDAVGLNAIPKRFVDAQWSHYFDVFDDEYKQVWDQSWTAGMCRNEQAVLLRDDHQDDAIVGGFLIQERDLDLRLRGFMVLESFRGHGYARPLLQEIDNIARAWLSQRDASLVCRMGVVTTVPYPRESEFSRFLQSQGWGVLPAADPQDEAEEKAARLYEKRGLTDLVRLRRVAVDRGVVLPQEVQDELRDLDGKQRLLVVAGLDGKLSHFRRSGKVSYSYTHCPVCADVGMQPDGKGDCTKCYIPITCQLPFHPEHGLRDDHLLGAAYWYGVRQFLLNL